MNYTQWTMYKQLTSLIQSKRTVAQLCVQHTPQYVSKYAFIPDSEVSCSAMARISRSHGSDISGEDPLYGGDASRAFCEEELLVAGRKQRAYCISVLLVGIWQK